MSDSKKYNEGTRGGDDLTSFNSLDLPDVEESGLVSSVDDGELNLTSLAASSIADRNRSTNALVADQESTSSLDPKGTIDFQTPTPIKTSSDGEVKRGTELLPGRVASTQLSTGQPSERGRTMPDRRSGHSVLLWMAGFTMGIIVAVIGLGIVQNQMEKASKREGQPTPDVISTLDGPVAPVSNLSRNDELNKLRSTDQTGSSLNQQTLKTATAKPTESTHSKEPAGFSDEKPTLFDVKPIRKALLSSFNSQSRRPHRMSQQRRKDTGAPRQNTDFSKSHTPNESVQGQLEPSSLENNTEIKSQFISSAATDLKPSEHSLARIPLDPSPRGRESQQPGPHLPNEQSGVSDSSQKIVPSSDKIAGMVDEILKTNSHQDIEIKPGSGDSSGTVPKPSGSNASQLPFTPSRQDVESAIMVLFPAINGCARGKSGSMTAHIVVRNSGKVATVNVIRSPFTGTAVGQCIEGVIRRARFPRFEKPYFRVQYSRTLGGNAN